MNKPQAIIKPRCSKGFHLRLRAVFCCAIFLFADLEREGGKAPPQDHCTQRHTWVTTSLNVWISRTELLIEKGGQTLLYISWGYDSSLKMHEAALTDKQKCAPKARRQNLRKKAIRRLHADVRVMMKKAGGASGGHHQLPATHKGHSSHGALLLQVVPQISITGAVALKECLKEVKAQEVLFV
ncbi:MAG: hypothetical protein FRX49_05434 [Trebouxia sp. A1-2]|nr:MAG: hypothetical protein FRX49_05434 [Trebouxia sp. A1-2]